MTKTRTNLLGVDRGVGVVEGPDHIMGEPGARHNGTQPWKGKKTEKENINHSAKMMDSLKPFKGARRRKWQRGELLTFPFDDVRRAADGDISC